MIRQSSRQATFLWMKGDANDRRTKKPPSRHTCAELSSVSIKRMESALQKAKLVLCEWQISHSKWADDWDEPDQHYLAR